MDDRKRAKILISYKLNVEIETQPKIIRDKVAFWLESGNRSGGRFDGETPLVFVRKDLIKDLEVLDIANKLFIGLKKVRNEQDIKRLYENVKGGNKDNWLDYEIKDLMRGFGSDSDTHLKMPDYGYIAIKENTFKEATKEIHIQTIQKALVKERE